MKNLIVACSLVVFTSWNVLGQNIFRTVCQGNIARLDSLLQDKSINETVDDRGRSLLHWAVACKEKEMFEHLIDKGIHLNQEDFEHKIPMSVAVNFDNQEFFDLLLDKQPNNSWIKDYGLGLLEIAILKENQSFVRKLIELGVNVNGKNRRGSIPLEIAKRIGAIKVYELLLRLGADENKIRTLSLKGEYMGQEPPGNTPKLFAPHFISTEESEFGSIFNASGTEFFYAVDVNGKHEIRFSKLIDNEWCPVETILSHERYGYNDPFLSNDENSLYFISKRALDGLGELKDVDIWYVEKEENGWSEPINVGSNINTAGNEYYISFTNEGTMYFSSNGHPVLFWK
ncbi:MAG: ankyrin repeat domain-containing protein [Bacteroidota bacterium]